MVATQWKQKLRRHSMESKTPLGALSQQVATHQEMKTAVKKQGVRIVGAIGELRGEVSTLERELFSIIEDKEEAERLRDRLQYIRVRCYRIFDALQEINAVVLAEKYNRQEQEGEDV